MYTYLFKVKYWNAVSEKIEEEVAIITNLRTYAEAVGELEDYYREDLDSFEVYSYEGGVAVLPIELYDQVKKGMDNG